MSEDISPRSVFEAIIRETDMFALQADESTDIAGKVQLLVHIRFVAANKIVEQFLFCKEVETTTSRDVFNCVNEYMHNAGMKWISCVGICTDGAGLLQ